MGPGRPRMAAIPSRPARGRSRCPHIAPKRGSALSYQRNVDAKGAVAVALCLHRWAAFDFFPELGGMGSNDAGHPRMLTVTTLHEGVPPPITGDECRGFEG